ncbi:MAG: 50S ribosomal protein L3 [Candidatus Yanofskybacteria bacterium RIFCSPHIGHO2_01_FULL_44_22]|uniref:Large ribosomal subunit protein uL3 n=1 Tax=Candidatus Yanofskybacteria bacterium RIFCSPHIGHO2_01_FULL_44_22 TaxID=1802669 RepID=A0A1F8ESX4_9BACT|nr:MAG: 50S ribosomal protein L3 [Candidatus Yanofskybacteria bacterium RIFCSPHIGHO2_01_FULL_44_22]
MFKFILGRKIGMSQIFQKDGIVVPITLIEAEPNVVLGIKTKEKDGYDAVQVGFETVSAKKIKKPQKGQFKESGNFKTVKEFRVKQEEAGENAFKIGDKLDVSVFSEGDVIKVSGLSKGKGFSGAVKRHGFHGMPASHGHHSVQRHVGSIGQRFPQHTLKGMRMAGRMGGQTTTVRGLKVAVVDKDNSFLAVKGAVPGNKGGLVMIQSQ